MNIEHLNLDARKLAAFAVNNFGGSGHPVAQPDDTLKFFERDYVVGCIDKAIKSGKISGEAITIGQSVLGALMIVNLYSVAAGEYTFESKCELAECFPDDPASVATAAKDIATKGEHRTGGGAAPVFVISKGNVG